MPRAVVAVTYSSVQSVSIHPLPLSGTPKTTTAMSRSTA